MVCSRSCKVSFSSIVEKKEKKGGMFAEHFLKLLDMGALTMVQYFVFQLFKVEHDRHHRKQQACLYFRERLGIESDSAKSDIVDTDIPRLRHSTHTAATVGPALKISGSQRRHRSPVCVWLQ